jgi:hypothetical protein
MLGIPVLGTRGASIDELVEENVTGHLIEPGDTRGLASGLVRIWCAQTPVTRGFARESKVTQEMEPERAVANLISLAGKTSGAAGGALDFHKGLGFGRLFL